MNMGQPARRAFRLTWGRRCDILLRSGVEPKGAVMQADPSQSPSRSVEGGSVVGLWRYPVKSMMGEELNATEVTERGLVGDRQSPFYTIRRRASVRPSLQVRGY